MQNPEEEANARKPRFIEYQDLASITGIYQHTAGSKIIVILINHFHNIRSPSNH